MRRAIFSTLFLFSSLSFGAISGDYEGTYTSGDGSQEGKTRISVVKKDDQTWDCKYSFNYGGEDIAAKTVTCAVSDKKLTGEYDADVQGTQVRISLDGDAPDDATLAGTYKATDSSGNIVGEGKWTVSQKH